MFVSTPPKGHPPAFNFDKSSNRDKLTVWAGLCGNGLIFGPYFFKENVDGRAYLHMLNYFVFPELFNHLTPVLGGNVSGSLVGA